MDYLKMGTVIDTTPVAVKFYHKLWKCLEKSLSDDKLGCHANNIVVHLGKSVESNYTYYDESFDRWCDYFLH